MIEGFPYKPKGKKVIFVGKGYDWWQAPKNAPTNVDVWGINDLILQRTDVDLMFNMHYTEDFSSGDMLGVDLASNIGIPTILPKKYDNIPNSIEFPLNEAIERFNTDYFMTGIAYMFALAIMLDYEEVECWGVNMRGDDEKYKNARACVEFWIGYAMGKGLKVSMNGKYCDCLKIFDRRLYGYNLLDEPVFQHKPYDINDRALYINFGVGLHRKSLDNLFDLLNAQKDSKYFNNINPIPINDPSMGVMLNNLHAMVVKQGDGKKFVGDVGFYNMLHVDQIINTEHSCKYIYIDVDDEDIVNEWMEFSKDMNFWTNPKCEYWNGDKQSQYDPFFPKYDMPKEEALRKFIKDYKVIAKRTQYKFPKQLKMFNENDLYTVEGQKAILKYAGYKEEEMIFTIKEEVHG